MNRADILKTLVKGRTLDIGCNAGDIHSLLPSTELYGVDLVIGNYRKDVVKGDAQALPFKPNSFDTVVAGELIEHLPEPEHFAAECLRILRSGGLAVVSTPNKDSLINRLFGTYWHRQYDRSDPQVHKSLFNIPELAGLFTRTGFVVDRIFCLPYDDKRSAKQAGYKWRKMRSVIHRVLPRHLQENMFVVGRKMV
jgi:SAM-dependent methyltransferase